jgi:hypothetical protein
MSRWMKRVVWFGVLPLAVLGGMVWLLGWLALRQVTPDNVVLQLESVFNCRARMDACSMRLFPPHLKLVGVQLSPRDEAADNATPPATRQPVVLHATYLRVREATVSLDFWPLLLRRELSVRRFLVSGADVKFDLLPGGENTLRTLFSRPATVKGRANPALIAVAPVAVAIEVTKPSAAPESGKKVEPASFGDEPTRVINAREFPAVSALGRMALEDSRIRLRNRKSRAVTELNGCTLTVSDLAIDPTRLDVANRATVALETRLFVDGKKVAIRYADLDIAAKGKATPFDPATGNLDPELAFDFALKKGSMVQALPVLQKLQKNIDRAQQAGLKMKDLTTEARLEHDTTLKLHLEANRLNLVEPAVLDFPDYSLHLEAKSFLDAGTETHEFRASLVASQAVSDAALAGADAFLAKLGEEAAVELRKLFITPMVKNGRITVAFVSTGDLDDPKVRADLPFQGIKDQLEGVGRQLRDSFRGKSEPKEKRSSKGASSSQTDGVPGNENVREGADAR